MKNQRKTVDRFIKQQGGLTSAAATIGVHTSSLWRWRNEKVELKGEHREAVEAVLRHPGDFSWYPENAVRRGRPRGGGP